MCESNNEQFVPEIKNRRKKLWELERSFCCPVVGNCLTLEELKKLGRQCKADIPLQATDYHIHRYFVHEAHEQNLISRKMQKFLDRKYAVAIRRFSKAKNESEVEQLWAESSERGDLTGPFWALATHSHSSENLLDRVHGEIHMLSHAVSRTNRSVIRQVRDQGRLIRDLQENHSRERHRLQVRLDVKNKECERLSSELQQVQSRTQGDDALEGLRHTVERLQSQLEATLRIAENNAERAARMEFQLQERKREVQALEQQNREQEASLKSVGEELRLAESQLNLSEQQVAPEACDGCGGESMNLCGQCVLYVGGRAGIKQHYREVVEKNHGNFIHHDGGQEDAYNRLHGDVLKADTVFCPVDCVSHTAALNVKELCKRHGKQLVMLRSSGLSSLLKGLQEIESC